MPDHIGSNRKLNGNLGWIFKIQRHALHDGPGIRTLVFFKGCPLRCLWCFNPESHTGDPQVIHNAVKCLGCGTCLEVCPTPGAIEKQKDAIVIRQDLCNGCGICVDACPGGAMSLAGEAVDIGQVLHEVLKDKVFYERSGGGVTLSGGEVAMQPEFAAALLQNCQTRGIHTAVETSGHAPWPSLQKILQFTDLVLYDLKVMNPVKHRELTGCDNRLILSNAKKLARSGKAVIIRIPLIPGCNDSRQNLTQTVKFIRQELPGINEVHLLPYEMIGVAKYERLGRVYALDDLRPPGELEVDALKKLLDSQGFKVRIKG
jgi:pyruvate formate lyase activating enzyme